MSRYPSYNSPLLLPDLKFGQQTIGSGRGSSGSKKDDGPEGNIGDVRDYYNNISAIQGRMTEIMKDYGIGNMSYAEQYDEEYIALKNKYNELASPQMHNTLARRLKINEDFKALFKDPSGTGSNYKGQLIDLGYWNATQGLKSYNTTLYQMENAGLGFDYAQVELAPNLTSFEEALQLIGENYKETTGYEEEIAKEISTFSIDGNVTDKSTSQATSQKDNTKAIDAAQSVMIAYGGGFIENISAGMTRGFLTTKTYSDILAKHDGKTHISNTQAYRTAYNKFVVDNIKIISNEYRKKSKDYGKDLNSASVQLQNAMNLLTTSALYGDATLTTDSYGRPYKDKTGNVISEKITDFVPDDSSGHFLNSNVSVIAEPAAKQILSPFKLYFQSGEKYTTLDSFAASNYVTNAQGTATFIHANERQGWYVVDTNMNIMTGTGLKPMPQIGQDMEYVITDENGNEKTVMLPGTVVYGSPIDGYGKMNPNASGGRSEQMSESLQQTADKLEKAGEYIRAAQLDNYATTAGVKVQQPLEEFERWGKQKLVPVATNFTMDVDEVDMDSNSFQKWSEENGVEMETITSFSTQKSSTRWTIKGKHVTENQLKSAYIKDEKYLSNADSNQYYGYDHSKMIPLLRDKPADGYTEFEDTGYYIANGHENAYTVGTGSVAWSDKEQTYVQSIFQVGLENTLLNSTFGREAYNTIRQNSIQKQQRIESGRQKVGDRLNY